MRAMLKWIPVIDQDECTGCNACVDECETQSLDLVDGPLAELARPATCCSSEACIAVCPVDCMKMEWREVAGDTTIGRWQAAA